MKKSRYTESRLWVYLSSIRLGEEFLPGPVSLSRPPVQSVVEHRVPLKQVRPLLLIVTIDKLSNMIADLLVSEL